MAVPQCVLRLCHSCVRLSPLQKQGQESTSTLDIHLSKNYESHLAIAELLSILKASLFLYNFHCDRNCQEILIVIDKPDIIIFKVYMGNPDGKEVENEK
jgi:hypothetical protein